MKIKNNSHVSTFLFIINKSFKFCIHKVKINQHWQTGCITVNYFPAAASLASKALASASAS